MRTHAATIVRWRIGALLLLLGLALVVPAPVLGAILTVTDCGDTGGTGQLRTLVGAAVSGDVIRLPACTITLLGSHLTIDRSLALQGAGATRTAISGGRAAGVLVGGGATTDVTLADLTVRDGQAWGDGGGILHTGGMLTLRGVAGASGTAVP